MPGNLGKLIKPTGLEGLQASAAMKHKLADSLLNGPQNFAPNWAGVLAAMLQGYGGKKLEKQAESSDEDYRTKLLGAYTQAHSGFQADVAAGMTPQQLQAKWGDNQFVGEELKPYSEAMTAALKKHAENPETLARKPDGSYAPITEMTGPQMDPNATVIPDGKGGWQLNPLKITADRLAQGNGPPINAVTSMPAQQGGQPPATNSFIAPPQPAAPQPAATPATGGGLPFDPPHIAQVESNNNDAAVSRAGARAAMQVMPSTAHDPGFGVRPAANESPAEYNRVGRDYAAAMLKRYGDPQRAAQAYNGGPGRLDNHLATGTPLPAETQAYGQKFASGGNSDSYYKPSGVVNGRPYWLINGVPYDNPNGN